MNLKEILYGDRDVGIFWKIRTLSMKFSEKFSESSRNWVLGGYFFRNFFRTMGVVREGLRLFYFAQGGLRMLKFVERFGTIVNLILETCQK